MKDFLIRYTSAVDGRVYEGMFTAKKLSIKAITAMQVRKVQLNGGYYFDENKPGVGVDETTDWTNYMIAHLEQSLVRKPAWWNLDELDEIDLLAEVFKQVVEFENSFRSPQRGAALGLQGSQTDSGRTSSQPGAAGHVETVGRGEVPPSLDP